MIVKTALALFTSLAIAYPQQSPLIEETDTCLSPSISDGQANLKACCSGSKTGYGTVSGVNFTYTCGQRASPITGPSTTVSNAYDCAAACGSYPDCKAAAWTSAGNCRLTTTEEYTTVPDKENKWVLLARTGNIPTPQPGDGNDPSTPGSCGNEVKRAVEKAQEEHKKQCTAEKGALEQGLKNQCSASKVALRQELNATCNNEKALLEKNLNGKCAIDKRGLQQQVENAQEAYRKSREATESCNLSLNATRKELAERKNSVGEMNRMIRADISGKTIFDICNNNQMEGWWFTVKTNGCKSDWMIRCNSRTPGVSTYYGPCPSQSLIDLAERGARDKLRAVNLSYGPTCEGIETDPTPVAANGYRIWRGGDFYDCD